MIPSATAWIEATALSHYVNGHYWVWPTLEILHFIGLAVLIGSIGLFDLRVLGLARSSPIGPLTAMMRWGICGFAVNMLSGILFFIGQPSQYASNIAFYFKMLFVLLAGLNVMLYYVTGVHLKVESVGAGGDAPLAGKVIAAVSLFLWFGVLYFGRMLPYIGNSF